MDNDKIHELIATKIMGWKTYISPGGEEYWWDEHDWIKKKDWFPLASIELAMDVVVKKMIEDGFDFDCGFDQTPLLNHWWAAFQFMGSLGPGDDSYYFMQADTAPRAICLAALKAVGVEIT